MKKAKQPASGTANVAVDLKELERLTAFMAHHGLEELEYQRGGVHIRLRKPTQPGPAHGPQAVRESTSHSSAGSEDLHLHKVKSPIVGTFYECPTPGAEPFVKVGDKVTAGQVLCIIEAMKLMNEIEADLGGEIVSRLVENGQPVEYGQALFSIRPAP